MTSQFFLIILSVVVTPFVLLLFIEQERKKVQARRLPPGPRKLPLIGNLHQLGDVLQKSLLRLSNEYGPLMFLQLGSVPTLVVSSANMARNIFKTHDIIFSGRPELYAAKKLSYNGNNIAFAPYDENWRELRKIAILELLSLKRVQSFQVVRDEEVELMLNFIAHTSDPINLSRLTLLLANNIVCRVIFGKKFDTEGDDGMSRFDEMMRETQALLGKFNIADSFPWLGWLNRFNGEDSRLEKKFQDLDMLFEEVIQEHLDPKRPKPQHEDLVDVLLRIQKDPNQAIALTNEQIKGVLEDMFIAGTDTSAATLVWTMTELIRNPSVMRRAQDEVRGVVKEKEKVTESDISKLTYLKLVIKEALRFHPPAPLLVPRETIESCTIEGYEIPAKTMVFVNAKAIAMDPTSWENPEEFNPERFLHSSIDFKGQNFELIPFGVGRRVCPGINFAVLLIELALANLLLRFDWQLPHGVRRDDINMDEALGITMHKKTPLCLVATPSNINV